MTQADFVSSKLSMALKTDMNEITTGFQEIKINHNGKCMHAKGVPNTANLSILVSKLRRSFRGLFHQIHLQNHNAALKKKQQTTGEWFTKGEDFADWNEGSTSFLWLHGNGELSYITRNTSTNDCNGIRQDDSVVGASLQT